jgi:hypothetical protein
MNEIPIACTLDPAQMRRRGEDIRAIGRRALAAVERGERQVTLRFRPAHETRERVEALVAAEAECCAFLDFTVAEEQGAILVTIVSPPAGEPVMHELADLFAAEAEAAA